METDMLSSRFLLLAALLTLSTTARGFAQDPITLKGHKGAVKGAVNALAFSPDGKTLVSAATDARFDMATMKLEVKSVEAKIWDLTTRKERAALTGFVGTVFSLAFSPTGKTIASCGGDTTGYKVVQKDGKAEVVLPTGDVKLWDPATGKVQASLTSSRGLVYRVSFSPDGSQLATASDGGIVRLWNVATHKEEGALQGHQGPVMSLAYSADGKTLVSADSVEIKLWDVASRKERRAIKTFCMQLALSPDGKTLATSTSFDPDNKDDKHVIRLWDAQTGKARALLRGHKSHVFAMAFAPDGKTLASASDDGTARLWNVATAKQHALLLDGETGAVYSIVFSPDGRLVATGSYDRSINIWETAKVAGQK